MKNIFIILTLLLSSTLYAKFINLNPTQVQKKIDQEVLLIDIRTPEEWRETGIVPTSKKMMFFSPDGTYDVQGWLNKLSTLVKDKNTPIVLICRTGSRTKILGDFLSKQVKFTNVFHLEHGIYSWMRNNRKTLK